MTLHVPVLSIVLMVVSCLASFVVPVALMFFFKKKSGDVVPFFVGFGVMLIFAFGLEQIAHNIILGSPAGASILGNKYLYSLYGGLMAGIFEETGRFLAFKTVLKKYRAKDENSIMYGIGHGGCEAMLLLGVTMINNIAIAVMINSGNIEKLTADLQGAQLMQMQSVITSMVSMPSYYFILGCIERLAAITLHITFSIMVWYAVKNPKKFYLFPAAIIVHAAVDAVTVLMSRSGVNSLLVEMIIVLMTIGCAFTIKMVWDKNYSEEGRQDGQPGPGSDH